MYKSYHKHRIFFIFLHNIFYFLILLTSFELYFKKCSTDKKILEWSKLRYSSLTRVEEFFCSCSGLDRYTKSIWVSLSFFSKEDINKILEEFCNYRIKEFKNYKKKYDTDFLIRVVNGVHQNEKKITKIIESNLSENWLIDRVDLTMKAIISLAIYELISYENIPLQVIINEYVSIANQYLDKSNTGFINGILDNIAKNIRKS